jgi:hypothetical protein
VVFFSQEEAGRLGENYVSSEHLLLGLVRENGSVAARILDRLGVSPVRIRAEIERQVGRGDGPIPQDMQLTPRAKRVIDLAYDEARQLNNNYIGTEHLLLGLICEGEGLAGRILIKLGVDLERTRNVARELQYAESGAQQAPGAGADAWPGPAAPPVGARGVLRDDGAGDDASAAAPATPRAVVEVATNAGAFLELRAAFAAKDRHGYQDLHRAGAFFLVPADTPALCLEAPRSGGAPSASDEDAQTGGGCYVRVLGEGEHAGRAGWVFHRAFHASEAAEEDEPPFPPPL